jgi:hypothetical protein
MILIYCYYYHFYLQFVAPYFIYLARSTSTNICSMSLLRTFINFHPEVDIWRQEKKIIFYRFCVIFITFSFAHFSPPSDETRALFHSSELIGGIFMLTVEIISTIHIK